MFSLLPCALLEFCFVFVCGAQFVTEGICTGQLQHVQFTVLAWLPGHRAEAKFVGVGEGMQARLSCMHVLLCPLKEDIC